MVKNNVYVLTRLGNKEMNLFIGLEAITYGKSIYLYLRHVHILLKLYFNNITTAICMFISSMT